MEVKLSLEGNNPSVPSPTLQRMAGRACNRAAPGAEAPNAFGHYLSFVRLAGK